jgi:ABC-type sugar transport system ATPase subunit
LAPKERDIAMVFQNYALYPHRTVGQNMAFALRLRHINADQIREQVDDTAGLLGLNSRLKYSRRKIGPSSAASRPESCMKVLASGMSAAPG